MSKELLSYVMGYATNPERSHVLLIRRERTRGPKQLAGRINGIGGKIEPGEPAHVAMAREFEEETGIKTDFDDWTHATTIKWDQSYEDPAVPAILYLFRTDLPWPADGTLKTHPYMSPKFVFDTDEGSVCWWEIADRSWYENATDNTKFLLPLAVMTLDVPAEVIYRARPDGPESVGG